MRDGLTLDVREFQTFASMARGSKTVNVHPAESVELSGAYWDEGSRSSYAGFNGAPNPQPHTLPRHGGAPQFGGTTASVSLAPLDTLSNSLAYVVDYSVFRGKHMPPRVYMHPSRFETLAREVDARNPRPELTPEQRACLTVTATLIPRARRPEFERDYPSTDYMATRETLAALGLLSKTGAITPAGRNALR